MKLEVRATGMRPFLDVFVHGMPGSGKTQFILSSYFENESGRGGPIVIDFDKGGVDATAANLGLSGKIPTFEPANEEQAIFAICYPERVVEQVHAMPEFADYKVTTFAIDTLSSWEDLVMGTPARAESEDLPASTGSGLMKIKRKRDESYEPAPGDYKALISRTKALMRYVREMPYHTITTCHTVRHATPESPKGLGVPADEKEYGYYPALVGDDNRVNIGKLCDVWLYMYERGGKFFANTRNQGGAIARTRMRAKLPNPVESPDFPSLLQVFNELRESEV